MNLERRAFLTVLVALVIGTGAAFAIAQGLVFQSVRAIEVQGAAQDVARASQAVRHEIEVLDRTTGDWAHWDDAYEFVQGRNPGFAESNLVDGSFTANRLTLMLFLDASGGVVYGSGFDLASGQRTAVPAVILQDATMSALRPPYADRSVSGLLGVDGQAMMVSSWAILTSDLHGPPAGTLVWGRAVDSNAADALRTQTLLDLALRPWSQVAADPFVAGLAAGGEPLVQAVSSRTLVATGRLDDVFGQPILALEVRLDRPVYQQSVQNLAYGLSSTILVGGGVLVLITMILDRSVFTPLSHLRRDVESISTAGGARIEGAAQDEIGQLAGAFNRLLERIDLDKAELERSNRDLREFAAVVSHDLQPPLSTIALNAAVVRERERGKLEPYAVQRLDRLEATALRMAQHIRSILDYSRVSYQDAPMEEVNLNQVIEEVINDLEERLHATGGRIEYRSLPRVEGNRTQLQQLLQNLMGNALKYHIPGVAPVVKVHAQPLAEPQGWRITIEDNGMGFNAADLDRLVRPYTRLEHRVEGHGLGLATCHKIIERHHGRLSVESSPGKGSRFMVDLPVKQPKPGPGPAATAA